MECNTAISYIRELTWFERLLWRLHIFFGYYAYKSAFGISMAAEWRMRMLDVITRWRE